CSPRAGRQVRLNLDKGQAAAALAGTRTRARVVLRWSRLLVRWATAALATVAILGGALAWRVMQGPVSLDFLAPYISEALTIPRLGIKADIGDVVVAWSERDQSLNLRLTDVAYRVEDERVAL